MANEGVKAGTGETSDTGSTTKNKKPDGIPEKFWDAEAGTIKVDDLAKSYTELEKKQSANSQKKTQGDPPPSDDPLAITGNKEPEGTPEDTEKLVADLSKELNKDGSLSDASLEKLKKAKIPKSIIEGMAAGQKATSEKNQSLVFTAAGGKDVYEAAVAWAAENLPKEEVQAYNESIQGKPVATVVFQAKALVSRYNAEGKSKSPNLTLGGSAGSPDSTFKNKAEMMKAMQDPRYKTDPEYRAKVGARLKDATFIN